MAILVINLIGFTGCTGNAESTLVAPEFEEPGAPPIEVTVEQLYAEFVDDEEAAKAKYKGQRLSFIGVTVEDVSNSFYAENPTDLTNVYVLNGSVEFRPRYNVDTELVREGFVLDIVGEVRGLFGVNKDRLIVKNCWINIVEGDIGAYYGEPAY